MYCDQEVCMHELSLVYSVAGTRDLEERRILKSKWAWEADITQSNAALSQ